MATYLHVAPAVALAAAIDSRHLNARWLLLGMACAVLPDADGVLPMLHLTRYGDTYGHRGFTHSIGFALLIGGLVWALRTWAQRDQPGQSHPTTKRVTALLATYVALCTLSHPLIDGLIDVGICNAWLWPLDGARHCLPWRPIPMQGVGLFGAGRFVQECLWIGVPLVVTTALWRWSRER